jgi:hypothetical protein
VSQGYFSGFSLARRKTACAPTTRMRLRYWSPCLEIGPSLCLPPVESCRGTRPIQAAKSRPDRKIVGSATVATKNVLNDIQTDRGNLHLDGSPHVIRLQRSPYGTSMPGTGAVHHIKSGPGTKPSWNWLIASPIRVTVEKRLRIPPGRVVQRTNKLGAFVPPCKLGSIGKRFPALI